MTEPTHDSLRAQLARASSPGYGYCLRCGMPWNKVDHHTTWYLFHESDGSGRRGLFALCEECWQILGAPEARIEYYAKLIESWERFGSLSPEHKRAIQQAVANGG